MVLEYLFILNTTCKIIFKLKVLKKVVLIRYIYPFFIYLIMIIYILNNDLKYETHFICLTIVLFPDSPAPEIITLILH